MNVLKFQVAILFTFFTVLIYGQSNDPVLLKINGNPVLQSDFEYAYYKDMANDAEDSKQTIDEFLQSFINFKLKVEEAKEKGFDKQRSFISEYTNYLEQIEKPYLTDSITLVALAEKIYDHLKVITEISRIFVAFPQNNILPKDTIEVYRKALEIRNLVNEDNFEELVVNYSEDTISKKYRIPGYLGWKTSMSFPYPLEKGIFSTPVGSVTPPIRVNTGYEIIKIHNRKPDPGQVNIAHILLAYPQQNPTEHQMDSLANLSEKIYQQLLNGNSYEELTLRYSSDRVSAEKGGNIGWFGTQRPLTPFFDSIFFNIEKIGDITPPVKMGYGYHIFKLIDKIPFSDWETMKPKILEAIPQNDRYDLLVRRKINALKEKYPYTLVEETYTKLEEAANHYELSDSIYFKSISPIKENILLYVNDRTYKVSDLIYFMEKNPGTYYTLSSDILSSKTKEFILDRLVDGKRQDIFNDYPQVKHLAQEFYEGILYFDIMNSEIWEKARTDREGLEKLFLSNKNKYRWDAPKFKGYIIHAKDKDIIKKAEKLIKVNKGSKEIDQILRNNLNTDSLINVVVEKGLWAKGENAFVDRKIFKTNAEKEIIGYPEYITEGRLINSPEELVDVSGLVISDYQEIMDKQWIDNLREKYSVEFDENTFQMIKKRK